MRPRVYACLSVYLLLAGAVLISKDRLKASPMASEESRTRLVPAYARMPLNFEANRGQTDPRVTQHLGFRCAIHIHT